MPLFSYRYPHPAVTTDCVVFGYDGLHLNVLLIERGGEPYKGCWAFPGGFLNIDEDAPDGARRELMEETGITVKNIKYFGTQSWPFPSQLMIAFTAEWESGDIHPQDDELSDAGWFSPDDCPATPQPGSIAYRLIHNIR